MKKISKIVASAAVIALITTGFGVASPASAAAYSSGTDSYSQESLSATRAFLVSTEKLGGGKARDVFRLHNNSILELLVNKVDGTVSVYHDGVKMAETTFSKLLKGSELPLGTQIMSRAKSNCTVLGGIGLGNAWLWGGLALVGGPAGLVAAGLGFAGSALFFALGEMCSAHNARR